MNHAVKASLPPIITDMRQFLTRLIEKHDPQPAGKDTVTSMINAGEESVAVEIIAENYYEHDVALTAEGTKMPSAKMPGI
jgi:hypothetical protein